MLVPGNRYAMPSGKMAVFVREVVRNREFKFRYLDGRNGKEGSILNLSKEFVRRMLHEDGIIWMPPVDTYYAPGASMSEVVKAPQIESTTV
ncbi:hypothetical protein [Cupriavidus necator]